MIASIIAPLSYLYYYYLNYSLLQEFLDYYMVLASMVVIVLMVNNPSLRTFTLSLLLAFTTLVIHPYEYLALEAYVAFLIPLGILLRERRSWNRHIHRLFLLVSQAFGSVLVYYLIEYPIRLSPVSNIARFNVPAYAFKDNFNWLFWITKQTFFENGQFVLGIFFVIGIIYILIWRKNEYSLALLAFVAYIYFLAINKIILHIPIPYYSGIWSTERIYVLLTPVLPIIEGAGFYFILSHLLGRFHHKHLVGVTFALLLLPSAFYVNAWNVSFEKASCIDGTVLSAFHYIDSLNVSEVFTPSYPDSSAWLILYLTKRKYVTSFKTPYLMPKNSSSAIIYVDSRGCGDMVLGTQKFNPWVLLNHHKLLFFKDNVWVFNATYVNTPNVPRAVYEYYILNSSSLDLSNMRDWKYLSYGFLLKHPVVIYTTLFEKGNYSLIVNNISVISIVPTRHYTGLYLGLYLPSSKTVKVRINGSLVGEFNRSGIYAINYTFNPGTLYLIELRGVPWYAVTEVRFER
ncbi:hypothetical protein [Thermococcus prieurii]